MNRGRQILNLALKDLNPSESASDNKNYQDNSNYCSIAPAKDVQIPTTTTEDDVQKPTLHILSNIIISAANETIRAEVTELEEYSTILLEHVSPTIVEDTDFITTSSTSIADEESQELQNATYSDVDDSDKDPPYVQQDSDNSSESEDLQSEEDIKNETNNPEDNTEDSVEEERRCRPHKGRKRKFPTQTYTSRKKLKDSNQPYYTVKGTYKNAKPFLENYDCRCKKKCSEIINNEKRKQYFHRFYEMGSYDLQTTFLAACVKETNIKRKRNKTSEKRNHTRLYTLNGTTVCKDFFMQTLNVTSKRIDTAVKKFRKGILTDQRGVKSGGKNKIPEATVQSVIEHIDKFPRYKSHYCRNKTESLFLSPDLTEIKMYELYKSENRPDISFSMYKKIFYENFNLRRKKPSKDTCNTCDKFDVKIKNTISENGKLNIKQEHEIHLKLAEKARQCLKADMQLAKENETVETITFDMEKTLPLPKIPTNLVFYKRQLWVYNEGIHSGKTNKGFCFLWKEGDAGRGAQEVGSCIKMYLECYASKGIEELILWSDSCGGQNRNIKMVLMLKALLAQHESLKRVYLKFLISGHSFLPNDSDFGDIESALKHYPRLYTVDDYKNVIISCRKKNKLVVHPMSKKDFYSVAEMEKNITNRKSDTQKEKISWLKTRVIKIVKDKPFSIYFKEDHESDSNFREVMIHKGQKGRTSANFANHLKVLWPDGKAISSKKLENIKELLPFIPKDAQHFYKNLKGMDFEDTIEGFGGDADFDVEESSDEDEN